MKTKKEKRGGTRQGSGAKPKYDEATQDDCWFQIVNTVEDMSDNPTWDEVIEHLKVNYMVVPRNYR